MSENLGNDTAVDNANTGIYNVENTTDQPPELSQNLSVGDDIGADNANTGDYAAENSTDHAIKTKLKFWI